MSWRFFLFTIHTIILSSVQFERAGCLVAFFGFGREPKTRRSYFFGTYVPLGGKKSHQDAETVREEDTGRGGKEGAIEDATKQKFGATPYFLVIADYIRESFSVCSFGEVFLR